MIKGKKKGKREEENSRTFYSFAETNSALAGSFTRYATRIPILYLMWVAVVIGWRYAWLLCVPGNGGNASNKIPTKYVTIYVVNTPFFVNTWTVWSIDVLTMRKYYSEMLHSACCPLARSTQRSHPNFFHLNFKQFLINIFKYNYRLRFSIQLWILFCRARHHLIPPISPILETFRSSEPVDRRQGRVIEISRSKFHIHSR